MFFPEGLYTLSARDQQVTWLDPGMYGEASGIPGPLYSNTIAGDGSVSQQVPEGRALILQHVLANFQPGPIAAPVQVSTLRRILVRPPNAGTTEVWLKEERNALAAGVALSLDWQGSLLVPPRWFVQAYAEYNGGVANELTLNIGGMLIPIGNVQRL